MAMAMTQVQNILRWVIDRRQLQIWSYFSAQGFGAPKPSQ
jgi:hypothetical protein